MKIKYPQKINLTVKAIKILKENGMKQTEIAEVFGKSKPMISYLKNKSPEMIKAKLNDEEKRKLIMEHLPKDLVERIERIRFAGRDQFEVQLRAQIVGELREKYKFSFPVIGLAINKDHISAIHLYNNIYKKSK